jgi:hypothetical protein
MSDKEPVLVVFDLDGTLAQDGPEGGDIYDEQRLAALEPWPNMVAVVRRYIAMPNVAVMFCSGRPKARFRVTWDWLNRQVDLSGAGKSVTLALRPESIPEDRIAAYKLSEIVQAVRRLGSKPSEALVFDDDIQNLQMFEIIRPMVRRLRLYLVANGVASQWGE